MIKYISISFILTCLLLPSQKLDINNADINDLSILPFSKEKINDINDYLLINGKIETIYDLSAIPSINSEDLKILKEYIYITDIKNENNSLRSNLSYKIDWWLSSEGSSEGISELWLDKYYSQQNINKMNYDDLSFLPNVSPIDVLAIMTQQERGNIEGTFQLKNSPGISYYGYKNVLDFIVFEDQINKKVDARYSVMARNIPSYAGLSEEDIPIDFIDVGRPETLTKLLIGYDKIKFGLLKHSNLGDPTDVNNNKGFIAFEKIGLSDSNPWLRIDNIILGNFNARFGQGLIFESGDSFQPRRTGHGFSKRETGITYDLTRSSQFVLSGYAMQLSSRKMRFSIFYSDGFLNGNNMRDAVINADGSFSTFINMTPRLGYGYSQNENNKFFENMINSVEERTLGGNLRYFIDDSFNIGFTIYESSYDRILDPQILETVVGGDDDIDDAGFDPSDDWDEYSGDGVFEIGYMSNSADPEIRAMYSNSGFSNYWDEAQSFRKVYGFEFSKVFGNMSIQGEYGSIALENASDPSAFIINAYMQFDNFNLLVLFRDYDLDYDNPYQRSFSQYRRYKSTIFEDSYWLEDPIFYNLYSSNPQPQAERGYYVESRYQFHEDLIAGIQWDSWVRKADQAQYFRIVNKLEWRPLFNYRIYFRYKLQSRGSFNIAHPSPYFTKEARIRFKIRLSNYDNLEFLYSWNYTTFSPRPRLTGDSNPFSGGMSQGDIGKPDGAIGFSIEHNFNKHLKMKAGVVYADGFLWYIEDNDFRLFDTDQGISHSWISFNMKPTNMLTVNFKLSHSSDFPTTTIVTGQASSGYSINNPYVFDDNISYKIQIDYAL